MAKIVDCMESAAVMNDAHSMTSEMDNKKANILGVAVDAVSIASILETVDMALTVRSRGYVCVTSAHGIVESRKDPVLRRILNSAFLNVPDGMPLVWMGKGDGIKGMVRVHGPDLMLAVCRMSVDRGWSHFLYGGRAGIAERLADSLRDRFPGIRIAGAFTPPFGPLRGEEECRFIAQISEAKADILWVGLSTPKQEYFMAENIARLPVTLMFGVGAAFDLHSGQTRDAPKWMKTHGLEWLFRLFQEPRRLWRRYIRVVPCFIFLALLKYTGLKTFSVERGGSS